jgi:predicted metal-dependent hydrolase
MKSALISLVAILALPAFAAEDISKAKQEELQNLDARIAALNTAKSCVNAAQDRPALKACHEALEKAHRDLQIANRERQKQHIDEQMKKLQEQKAKLDQNK